MARSNEMTSTVTVLKEIADYTAAAAAMGSDGIVHRAVYVWDYNALQWVKMTQPLVTDSTINLAAAVDQGDPALDAAAWPVKIPAGVAVTSLPSVTVTAQPHVTHTMGTAVPAGAAAAMVEQRPGMVPKTVAFFYSGGDVDRIETTFSDKKRVDQFAYSGGNLSSITTTIVAA